MPDRAPYSRSIPAGMKVARPNARAKAEAKRERDAFYSGARWRRLRAAFLAENPLCADCLAENVVTAATIPHHEKERLDSPELAYDPENLTPLCGRHHTLRHKKPGE